MEHQALFLIAGIVVAGVGAQWVANRLRVPAIVLLLGTGLVLGPGLGWLDPDHLFGDILPALVSLAVGVVLFEGGLSLKFDEAKKLGRPLWQLVIGGLLVTVTCATLAARYVGGLSWELAAIVGSILIVTGPTVIRPMLRQAKLTQRPARLLKWEAIVNDPIGALIAVAALEFALLRGAGGEGGAPMRSLGAIPVLVGVAGVGGWAAGKGFSRALDRGWIAEHLKTPVIFAGVMAVFAGADALQGEAGLLAVTVMGVVMANSGSASVEDVRRFKEEVTTLLVAVLFIVLAARLEWSDLEVLTGGALAFVLVVLFVVRPLVAWVSLAGSGLSRSEKVLIGWVAPRGVVAAAVAAAFEPRLIAAGYEEATMLVPVLFAVIVATVVLHGLTVAPLARRLGLASAGESGLLIVGATRWTVDLARALQEAGVEAILVDNHWRNYRHARGAGMRAVCGNVLSEETLDDLPMESVGRVLAATDDDAYNGLVNVALSKIVGRESVLQVTPRVHGRAGESEPHLLASAPWGEGGRFDRLNPRWWNGARFKSTTLSEEYDWGRFREDQPDAIVLFAIEGGKLRVVGETDEAPSGAQIVYLP